MALLYGFYNAKATEGGYDRTYDAEDFGRLFDGVITDGVLKAYGDKFKVTKSGNSAVMVGTGKGWFNGTWTILTEPMKITLSGGADLYAICLKVDKTSRVNTIYARKTGTPLVLERDEDAGVYEYCLATAHMSGGAISTIVSHVANGNTNVTPWAEGLLGGASGGASSGGGGTTAEVSSYTSKVAFNEKGFDLTFRTTNGLTYTNKFSVTEKDGKITQITNKDAGRSISVTYG